MKYTLGFILLLIIAPLCLSAQTLEAPHFGVELTIGANLTERLLESDQRGSGIYTDVSVQRHLPLTRHLRLSGGVGLYMHSYDYTDQNSLRFACDLPISMGGDGQQTFVETAVLHAGIFVPARLHLNLGQDNRWNFYGGADLKIPVFGQANIDIFECGDSPARTRIIESSTDPFRSILPEFVFGFGYGIRSPKGELVFVGPFASIASDTHVPGTTTLPSVRTTTIGLRAVGAI